MLIVKYGNLDVTDFINKYSDKVKMLTYQKGKDNEWLIKFIEELKSEIVKNAVVVVNYSKELILSFKALNIEYKVMYPQNVSKEEYELNKLEYDALKNQAHEVSAYIITDNNTIEQLLEKEFDWIKVSQNQESNIRKVNEVVPLRKSLTFKEIVENDSIEITDADIRDMKALTNKFKMTMLLQAKTRLKTVLKFCDVLDTLYNELINRIDSSLETTDTASLMYTADYIAKALSETNQFIMPLINNEKLQNFFIIDNSSVVNITDSRVDINKREKIRKAAEIVLDNIDYFTKGEYGNIVNPNEVDTDNKENERRVRIWYNNHHNMSVII